MSRCIDYEEEFLRKGSLAYSIADEGAAVIHVRFQGIHIEVIGHAGQEVLTNLFHALLGPG